jgi:DNA repair protein RadA/Sms
MAVYTCRRCGFGADEPWEETCPNCLGFYRPRKYGVDSEEQKGEHTTLGGKGTVSKVPRFSTGMKGFDDVLGGGLIAGKVVLLGGFEGAGKSRSLLTIADYIAKTQGKVIYSSGEESVEDVNMMAASLGIVNNNVIVLGNQMLVEPVLDLAKKVKAFLVIWDSAQRHASARSSGEAGSIAQCKMIGKLIKDHCGHTKTCSIIVNQMSNEGDLKGGTELRHHCDTIMVLAFAKPDDPDAPLDETDVRLLVNSKNRGGRENLKSYFKMNDEGRLELLAPRSKLVGSSGKYRRNEDDDAA